MVLGTVTVVGSVSVAVATGPAIAVAVGVGSTATATVGGTSVAVAAVTPSIGTTLSAFAGNTIISSAAPLISAGPVGWITLGCDSRSWDCWKPILHDESTEPSAGRLLRDVVNDARVKSCTMTIDENGGQQIVLQNIWNETFVVGFVSIEGRLAAHATKI